MLIYQKGEKLGNVPITIKNKAGKLVECFKNNQFYPKSDNNFGGLPVNIDDAIIRAICEIKLFYNVDISMTSTGRSVKRNSQLKGASPTSLHIIDKDKGIVGRAIDFCFIKKGVIDTATHNRFKADIQGSTGIYNTLKNNGVGEFIYHDRFNHIAIKSSEYKHDASSNPIGDFDESKLNDGKLYEEDFNKITDKIIDDIENS